MKRRVELMLLCAALSTAAVAGEWRWTLTNPTGRSYQDEMVRLKIDLPADAKQGDYVVKANGKEVVYQIEEVEGRKAAWVAATMGKDETDRVCRGKGRACRV